MVGCLTLTVARYLGIDVESSRSDYFIPIHLPSFIRRPLDPSFMECEMLKSLTEKPVASNKPLACYK